MLRKFATTSSTLVLILVLLVFLIPEDFKAVTEFFPLSVAGIVIIAMGTLLPVIGFVNMLEEKRS